MGNSSDDTMLSYASVLREHPGAIEGLPSMEASVARAAVDGRSVHEIAQDHGITEAAVWTLLESLTRVVSGHAPTQRTETGGLGSDTDRGVTGGYGDTGFGSLGNEPPISYPGEPTSRA